MSTCNSCGAAIEWVVTEKGRRMPLDPKPRGDGNIIKTETKLRGSTVVLYVRKDRPTDDVRARYVSHFATCPNAKQHRKGATK